MLFKQILDWSEVWAVAIPLIIFILKTRRSYNYLFPVLYYLIVAFCINLTIDIIWKYKPYMPDFLQDNNFLYNIHSIVRLYFFIWFFRCINLNLNKIFQNTVIYVSALCIIINFLFFVPFSQINPVTFAIEGFILLYYCVTFFLGVLRKEEPNTQFDPSLVIVTGLIIFEAVSFPIFLFFDTLKKESENSVFQIWPIHNIFYIIFCLFIARAFYGRVKYANH